MNAGKYDQIAGVAYGKCVDCDVTLETAADAGKHRAETTEPGRSSHRTQGMNPTRAQRIQSMVDLKVEDAIQDTIHALRGEVDQGLLTDAEVTEALNWYSEFANEWDRS